MQKYRKTIVWRRRLLLVVVFLACALALYDVFWASEEIRAGAIFGFQCGLIAGAGLLALIMIIRYAKILKDDMALKKQYNWENDERMRLIRAKAGMPMLLYTSVGLIFAGVVIGYVNETVFYTLVGAAMFQLVIGSMAKWIYMRVL